MCKMKGLLNIGISASLSFSLAICRLFFFLTNRYHFIKYLLNKSIIFIHCPYCVMPAILLLDL